MTTTAWDYGDDDGEDDEDEVGGKCQNEDKDKENKKTVSCLSQTGLHPWGGSPQNEAWRRGGGSLPGVSGTSKTLSEKEDDKGESRDQD